jgi:hypothetical protein
MFVTEPFVTSVVFVLPLGTMIDLPDCPHARQLQSKTASICLSISFAAAWI